MMLDLLHGDRESSKYRSVTPTYRSVMSPGDFHRERIAVFIVLRVLFSHETKVSLSYSLKESGKLDFRKLEKRLGHL